MAAGAEEKKSAESGFLDQQGLARLTAAWEKWAAEAGSPARVVARARVYLIFLLIRHGGLRAGEATAINAREQLDRETGMLEVRGANARRILLPNDAMRPLRRILSLPEAASASFCNLDPGFLRRTFYTMAQLAGVSQACGGPRAIRAARGNELLATHMPLELVRNYLGLRKPGQLAAFLKGAPAASHDAEDINTFAVIIESSTPGAGTVLLTCRTLSGIELACLCPLPIFMRLEPRQSMVFFARIRQSMVVLAEERPVCSAANILPCQTLSVREDAAEYIVDLSLEHGERLVAHVEKTLHQSLIPEHGMAFHAIFPASAVILLSAG